MAAAPRQRYRFDDLTLDVGQCRVWRDGQPIQLSKLTFELLRVLVEAAPNLVTHDQLAQHVWGARRIVTPENLSQRLMMLRQAIGDPADRPRYIEGVRGLGYRLIPAVAAESERGSGGRNAGRGPTTPPVAASEEPPAQLSRLRSQNGGLRCRGHRPRVSPSGSAHSSSRQDAGPGGAALGRCNPVCQLEPERRRPILRVRLASGNHQSAREGQRPDRDLANDDDALRRRSENAARDSERPGCRDSARRAAFDGRVTRFVSPFSSSIRARTRICGRPRTTAISRNVANIFAIQANIATNVSSALGREAVVAGTVAPRARCRRPRAPHTVTTSPRSRPTSRRRPRAAREHSRSLRQAVAIDPQFAARVGDVVVHTQRRADVADRIARANTKTEAIETALKALALEPDLAEAHKGLSFAYTVNGDWQRSDDEYAQALDLGATRAEVAERGNFELAVGRIEEARATFRNNQGVNPLNSTGLAFFLAASEILGDRDAVRDGYEQGRAFMGPWPFGEYLMNYVRLGRGELDALADDTAAAPQFRAEFARYGSSARRVWPPCALGTTASRNRITTSTWWRPRGQLTLATSSSRCGPPPAGPKSVRTTSGFCGCRCSRTSGARRRSNVSSRTSGLVDYWRLNGWPRACRAIGSDDFECD